MRNGMAINSYVPDHTATAQNGDPDSPNFSVL
jgi:hypothetical protein